MMKIREALKIIPVVLTEISNMITYVIVTLTAKYIIYVYLFIYNISPPIMMNLDFCQAYLHG